MLNRIKVSPSILDAFQNVLTGKYNETPERLIDKINKVAQYQETEAMRMGTAFHKLTVNDIDTSENTLEILKNKDNKWAYRFGFWDFEKELTDEICVARFGYHHEQRVERILETSFGPVLIYGYVDDVKNLIVQDLKTTKQYQGGLSFYDALQWRCYLYCTKSPVFRYLITDFTNLYPEQYEYYDELENDLRVMVEKYCAFLNENVNKINLQFVTY